jgi:hypothetical protein
MKSEGGNVAGGRGKGSDSPRPKAEQKTFTLDDLKSKFNKP